MRNRIIILSAVIFSLCSASAAEEEVKSKIESVTVFLNGAQVTRTFETKLKTGTNQLVAIDITPYMDPRTVQVKGNGDFTILSMRHRLNYIDDLKVGEAIQEIMDSLNAYQRKYAELSSEAQLLAESNAFLSRNQTVKGQEQLDADGLRKVHSYYVEELKKTKARKMKINYLQIEVNKIMTRYRAQLAEINKNLASSTSQIVIEVKADKVVSGKFMISYLVNHASWYPSYDIRVDELDEPLKLVYKANVQQNTGEDWDNVKLTFSNANPYQSGDLPVLQPYYLNFTSGGYSANPYKSTENSYNLNNYIGNTNVNAGGQVVDQYGQGVPFATIKVTGTSIGTITDEAGRFNLTLPQGKNQIFVSNAGYTESYANLSASSSNRVALSLQEYKVQEVVVDQDRDGIADEIKLSGFESVTTTYNNYAPGRELSAPLSYNVDGVRISSIESIEIKKSRARNLIQSINEKKEQYVSKPITVLPMENKTSLEIKLDLPFTIEAGGKARVISVKELNIDAYYEYRAVPKLEQAAFLIARIVDWSEYNLLEGEANLYFENTYIGKSILDVRFVTDTLNISLGRDKGVVIARQKVKAASTREFLGNDNIEKRQFEISVRNNKKQNINLIVYDQIPVSQHPKDIIVELKSKDGADHNETTGELKWKLKLDPSKNKSLNFKYEVKFPKNRVINLE